MEEVLSALTDENEWMPTAGFAHIELPIQNWNELTDETEGTLVNYWRPREIG